MRLLPGLLAGLLCLLGACSARRLPPGTPPPEYEPPVVAPWAAESLDAGVGLEPGSDAGLAPATQSELSLDAGAR